MLTLAIGLVAGGYLASSFVPRPGWFEWRFDGSLWRTARASVALTFDDGPDPERTPRILDALSHAGIAATFFVVGEKVARHSAIARRIVEEGHAIGNHSFHHTSFAFASRAAIEAEIDACTSAVVDACGVALRFVRPPFGHRNAAFHRVAAARGLTPVFWSVDSGDWLGLGARSVARRASGARRGDIVLLHDGDRRASATVDALPTIVRALSERGVAMDALRESRCTP